MSTGQGEGDKPAKERNPVVTGAAMLVVAIIVICAVVAVVLRFSGDSDDSSPATETPRPSVTALPSTGPTAVPNTDGAMQGLGTPTVDRLGRRVDIPKWPGGWALPQSPIDYGPYNPAVPVPAPAGVSWQKVNDGAIVPFSTSDGPSTVQGLTATGFAHTPQGAALAAVQIALRLGSANNETARGIYDNQTVMTAAQRSELYAQLDAEGPFHRGATDAALSYQTKSDAFRILDYDQDLAVIETASPAEKADNGTAQWLTTRLTATWVDGDWKLTFPEQLGDLSGTATSLSGWTPW
ncbi:hypothetical protein CH275_16355 [Rhodococcus sp. 06-235-1A]|uniref:hypothetical protein n=1 Tax=Rhodococcus sp. 06-235-1A TaxID=2022508 RepID=UPI000B9AB1CB|nr:hypothetical protein [Rhodococcus sp. 06-235-1A]OZD03353.1 hypothetical protein CH275_16355 [Rhodococcus sp. 06-235-1A]